MFRSRFASIPSFLKKSQARFFSGSSSTAATESYAGSVKFFHWTMGGSMLAATGFVLAAQNTKVKEEKSNYMFYHKSFGLLAAGLLVPRLAARFLSKTPGPIQGATALERIGGSLGHLAMYGFAIALPVTGVVMGSYSGFGLPFFWTTIPSIGKDPSLAKPAYEYHKIAGDLFEKFVLLHVAGAGWHFFRGHTIFARIVPGLSGSTSAAAANAASKAK